MLVVILVILISVENSFAQNEADKYFVCKTVDDVFSVAPRPEHRADIARGKAGPKGAKGERGVAGLKGEQGKIPFLDGCPF